MFFCASALKFQCRSLREFDLPPEPHSDHEKEAKLIGLVHWALPNGRVQQLSSVSWFWSHSGKGVYMRTEKPEYWWYPVWMIIISIPVSEYCVLFAAIFKFKAVNSTVAYCGLSTIKCQHDPPHLEQRERRTCNLKGQHFNVSHLNFP